MGNLWCKKRKKKDVISNDINNISIKDETSKIKLEDDKILLNEQNINTQKIKKNENKNEIDIDINDKFDESPKLSLDLLKIIIEAEKSLCKIKIKTNSDDNNINYKIATGFFLKIDNSKKYLITANHVLSEDDINKEISLVIYNKKFMRLKPEGRNIDYFIEKDVTIIEMKETDEIYNDIKFLFYDSNYIYGYEIYKNRNVFCIQQSLENNSNPMFSMGKIKDINNFTFVHTISTDYGSSGSPIILLNKNSNEIPVIGIHRGHKINEQINFGTFIGEIFHTFKKRIDLKNNDICLVIFISIDQLINFPISCKVIDNFSDLENKLFEQFPNLKNKNIYFLANGNVVNRASTLLENKIKNDTTILIDYND